MEKRIMLTGVSGVGKTTVARALAEQYGIPFVSGSYSDLVPETAKMEHKSMITQDLNTIRIQDYQVVNLRHKQLKDLPQYITDRSYFDSMAYWINKLSHQVPQCDSSDFLKLCMDLLAEDCNHLVMLSYTIEMMDTWTIENNGKRVNSKWYQMEVNQILLGLIKYIKANPIHQYYQEGLKEATAYKIRGQQTGRYIHLLVVETQDYTRRLEIIDHFIHNYA